MSAPVGRSSSWRRDDVGEAHKTRWLACALAAAAGSPAEKEKDIKVGLPELLLVVPRDSRLLTRQPRGRSTQVAHLELHIPMVSSWQACLVPFPASLEESRVVCMKEWVVVF